MFIDWKEGKNGSFLWQENCDFASGNVRDIRTVDSAKEDCGIKCQEHGECTHFTWNGRCILKKAPVLEKFRHYNKGICGKLKKITVLGVIPILDSMVTQVRQLGEQEKSKIITLCTYIYFGVAIMCMILSYLYKNYRFFI